MTGTFFKESGGFQCSKEEYQSNRNQFKKDLQKSGWQYIFEKMNMEKYATRGLREDINKFVEQQTQIPFTMRNIYKMLELAIGTTAQRMDKAILEVFDKITQHHHDNQYKVEGWKTNSHFLLTKKFIVPNLCWQDQRWNKGSSIEIDSGRTELINDFTKAICYITGDNFDNFCPLYSWIRKPYKIFSNGKYQCSEYHYNNVQWKKDEYYKNGWPFELVHIEPIYGEWFDWTFFRLKAFKKGTMHFEFKDENIWGLFNQRVAKIKGYPLFEAKKQTKYQERQTGRKEDETAKRYRPTSTPKKPNVLFEIELQPETV